MKRILISAGLLLACAVTGWAQSPARPTLEELEKRAATASREHGLPLARPEGLEPPASRSEVWRSIRLSYGRGTAALSDEC